MTETRLTVDSPLGPLSIAERAGKIVSLDFARAAHAPAAPASPLLRRAARELAAYFAGKRTAFALPLAPRGTAFQRKVWRLMRAIPFGETRSYGDLARALGSAPRAVGGACKRNPLPILVPCHRVVGADGALGGYSGGKGVGTKRKLLRLEGALP